MERWSNGLIETLWRGDIVNQSTYRDGLALITCFLPCSKNRRYEWSLEVSMKHLWKEIHVADQSRLQNDGHVGSIEQSNGIWSFGCGLIVGQFKSYPKSLEKYHDEEYQHRAENITHVWQLIPEECILDCTQSIRTEDDTIEKFNKGSFVLLHFCLSCSSFEWKWWKTVP